MKREAKSKLQAFLKGKKGILKYFGDKDIEKESEYRKSYSPVYRSMTTERMKFSNKLRSTGVVGCLVPDPNSYKKFQEKYKLRNTQELSIKLR